MKSVGYTYTLPDSPSFCGKGLFGFAFGALKQKDFEVLYVESEKGHDAFIFSKKIARTYYVLAGAGYFTIDNRRYDVSSGMLVEVPPRLEYCYSGKMTLLAFCRPHWSVGGDTLTKWNPDVVGRDSECVDGRPWSARLVRLRVLGKSPTNAFLRLNQRLWNHLPASFAALAPVHRYGSFLHTLARIQSVRAQSFSTFFLRNRPALELIRRLVEATDNGATFRVAVLGCSTGAEAYSLAWAIKSARPDLRLILHAVDISKEAVEFAKRGVYSLKAKVTGTAIYDRMGAGRWLLGRPGSPLTGEEIFERMTPAEMEEFFNRNGDAFAVKSLIKEGIKWHVGDVREPAIVDALGLQDLIVANNFLGDMDDVEAENCLRNIARLVEPGGYLFASGIDLDVRARVAGELGWKPVGDLLEEVHDGDPSLNRKWPCRYGGLEPLNRRRPDWRVRYATAFRLVRTLSPPEAPYEEDLCEARCKS